MLRRIGFQYAEQIDPFDGGPHFLARTDDITIVRDAAEVEVRANGAGDGRAWAIIATDTPGAKPSFRALGARVTQIAPGVVGLSDEARRTLGIEDGQKVWLSFG